MPDLASLIQQGSTSLWLFIPSAMLLGALHGLEPGHSKTMMAAFIVAIRGTVLQAVLLGLSATLSHTAVVWVVALAGLHFGRTMNVETSEPYFMLASAGLMALVALWMIWRTWRCTHRAHGHQHHDHHHGHDHGHDHHHHHHHDHHHHHGEHCHHDHEEYEDDHTSPVPHYHPPAPARLDAVAHSVGVDAHALAHAEQIERRFAGREVTTLQLILFGLTGGLIPCPASITVLLICLQLKKISLGVLLVLCFSIGLAVTMVSAGVIAALSMKQIQKRWSGFSTLAARAPYLSGGLILLIAAYVAVNALRALGH